MKNIICRTCAAGTVALLALGSSMTFNAQHAFAATQVSYLKKQIVVNGTTVSQPDGFVQNGTTYVPIWYVMNLLKSFSITSTWSGGVWSLQTPTSIKVTPKVLTTGTGQCAIALNGVTIAHVPSAVAVDPASGQNTTFMPIWYVMQLLNQLGDTSQWNGTTWTISTSTGTTTPSTTSQPSTATEPSAATGSAVQSNTSANSATTLPVDHPLYANFQPAVKGVTHVAADDSADFARASDTMYISAQTADPLASNSTSTSMDAVQPGQTVYLYTWSDGGQVNVQNAKWIVNSSNASITLDTRHIWSLESADGTKTSASEAAFVAQKPGVYTVQAEATDGTYSVPITMIVGLKQLSGPSTSIGSYTGIGAFTPPTGDKPTASLSNQSGTTIDVYTPTSDGWIPISGQTTKGLSEIEVTFGANPAEPTWSYAIPVNADGSFSAVVRSPSSGNVTMTFFTQYVEDMTAWGNGGNTVDHPLTDHLSVSAAAPSAAELDLFASAKMNYNLNPAIADMALALFEQAGSIDSGIEAINDFVADDIVYDENELQGNQYLFQNSTTIWNSKSGVCEDYAELAASMLKAIGIRTETIQGVAQAATQTVDPTGQNGDNHEWIQAFDGKQWILSDPTWSGSSDSSTGWLTSEFFTNTKEFASTHTADPNATATPA